ncbi:hypothetical protein BK126_00090 [Paenibacillus sp. FSL H7-0326]|uniref:hypothetical protein n=1 Tax=Paenibacillus sp. FSL H7-0326 TaxID=1921144 RepID=UPI00096EB7FB|nr:hypothetical protein [Paenibacillus sp. FSL H7-0326]OMC70572.1 hypothetical protein BK126_00090 [Paenibacillus sp. FSL H7-0326]
MRKFKLLVVLLFLCAAGCSGSSKEAELSYFLSDTEGMYIIHLFRDSSRELDNELLEYMNSSEDLLEVIQGIQLYDINTADDQIRAKRVDVEEIPTMLITDNHEIVLRTQSIQEVKNYFEDLIN